MGVSKGSLAFMQHFKLVNWRIRFLMSRTGYIAENCQIKFNWKLVKNYRLAFAFWAPVEDGDDGGNSPGEGVEAIFFDWIGIQFFRRILEIRNSDRILNLSFQS